jgi:hypothetical protein
MENSEHAQKNLGHLPIDLIIVFKGSISRVPGMGI